MTKTKEYYSLKGLEARHENREHEGEFIYCSLCREMMTPNELAHLSFAVGNGTWIKSI